MVALLKMPSLQENSDAERRIFPRKEVHMRVEGKRMDHSIDALRLPHLSLAVQDISAGGLGAYSLLPVDEGERINIFFPPDGVNGGWDALGQVVRCTQSPLGYRIGMKFDLAAAA